MEKNMKIAVLSDIHNGLENLNFVIDELNIQNIKHVICCGDITTSFIAKYLAENFKGEIYIVFGNMDEREETPKISITHPNFHHMGDIGEIEFNNKKISFIHYPDIALDLAESNEYDFVFYGHTHKNKAEKINNCLLLNPGELFGERHPASYAIVDLDNKEYNFIPV